MSGRPVPETPAGRRGGSRIARLSLALLALAGAGIAALVLLHPGRRSSDERSGQEASAAGSPAPLGVTLVPAALEHAGLRIEPLAETSYQRTVRAYGTVVDLHGLLDLRDRYAAAEAKAAAARARAAASGRESERLRGLYRGNRNVSATDLENAQAAAAADRAEEKASAVPVLGLAALARQDFGAVIGGWVTASSPALDRLVAGRESLIRVALPPDAVPAAPPATATIVVAGEPEVPARFVSSAARTDPGIQGPVFYYVSTARPGLLADRNVIALLPVGEPTPGARVPGSAVVWLDGAAWVYVASGEAGHFTRREIRTERPLRDGYVVTEPAPGTRVVVQGAALLLSEESRAAQPEATGDEDTD